RARGPPRAARRAQRGHRAAARGARVARSLARSRARCAVAQACSAPPAGVIGDTCALAQMSRASAWRNGMSDENSDQSLDPEDWTSLRALAHRAVDDAFDHLVSVRDRPIWQVTPEP